MAQLKFGSAGVKTRELDLTGPVARQPVGVPAGVIGTALRGPAFVPLTLGTLSDFYAKFGKTDGTKFGPLAVTEWMRSAGAVTYLRVLGIGDGKRRLTSGVTAGSVNSAGFVVGEQQPLRSNDGLLSANPYANAGGPLGRTFFLSAFMSESAGSTLLSDANIKTGQPIIRAVIMTPSGVIARLSSSYTSSLAPASNLVATNTSAQGALSGHVSLFSGGTSKEEFVLLLNGHKGADVRYPNVVTASFNMTAPNYFGKVLNTDPYKLQEAGHIVYASWDIHPSQAVVTGSGAIAAAAGAGANGNGGSEHVALLLTGSQGYNAGTATAPNYENFQNRYSVAKSPWFTSQKFGGSRKNLFRLHALDAGANISSLYKISIENITPSNDLSDKYGSFDVVIRDASDRDTDIIPLEAWRGVNLNPSSDRYISKVIGDANIFFDWDRAETSQNVVVDGQYPLQSNLVRVEVSSEVDYQNIDPVALPFGFRGHAHLMTSGSAPMASLANNTALTTAVQTSQRTVTPPVPFRKEISAGTGQKQTVNPLLYWGVQFEHATSVSTPNASTLRNESIKSFSKFFPDFMTSTMNFIVGDNEGEVDTAANGVLDADRFNNGGFSLDSIKVVTGSNGLADPRKWADAEYVRNGTIGIDDSAKTRAIGVTDFNQANRQYLKFSTFMQGGFDGVNIFDEDEANLTDRAVDDDMNDVNRGRTSGPNVKAYNKALDIMANSSNVDVQLLAIPGIRQPVVTNYAIDKVEERFDALYIMDIEQVNSQEELVRADSDIVDVTATVDRFVNRGVDSSFAASYFPDVVMEDPTTLTNVSAPPSVAVLGAIANNDSVGHPWFAPAGFARGALSTVQEASVKLNKENMDSLYNASVNPLVAFPGNSSTANPTGGVVIWGQKTLQIKASALDRVNVRRLLIDIRRQVRDIANTIIFENNREETLVKFSEAVTPRLQRIKKLNGLDRFKVVIDASTTTEQDVLNNTIRGKIFLQPTKTVEFVSIDFVVTNNTAV